MIWEINQAKNGESTLLLNGLSIYSKYRPFEDARQWINSEFDYSFSNYLLIGLGLGYHLEALSDLEKEKPIYVYYFEQQEFDLFYKLNQFKQWWKKSNIHIIHDMKDLPITVDTQIMIPNVWLKAIGYEHPLNSYLEDIKINQVTYKKSAKIMEKNFNNNISLKDFEPYPSFKRNQAALIASGPSLNETIQWLKDVEGEIELFVVGSALKAVLANQLKPSGVIISDPKVEIKKQLIGTNYKGPLFYLSTSNHEAVQLHEGQRHILFQNGYSEAEKLAKKIGLPCIDTGGSVSTTTFSLLELLGFKETYLFGMDLGFKDNMTHAKMSTSGRTVDGKQNLREVISNSGNSIFTTPNLNTYLRWMNRKMELTKLKVFNTAWDGAKINNVEYINRQQFQNLIHLKNL